MEEFRAQFLDFNGHDYRLRPGSSWTSAATDGRGLGADVMRVARVPRIDSPTRRPR